MELPHVPVKGWIIDPDEHGLLDGFSDVVHLPAYCGEIVHTDAKQRGVTILIDGERGSEMFL